MSEKNITSLNTIKTWFKTGLKPTQAQFWEPYRGTSRRRKDYQKGRANEPRRSKNFSKKNEYKNKMAPGYEGSFDTWLVPYVEPSYTIGIYDEDYPEKNGRYYAESVSTSFSEAGGKRTITPGIKLSK